jgi:hypothetical protein
LEKSKNKKQLKIGEKDHREIKHLVISSQIIIINQWFKKVKYAKSRVKSPELPTENRKWHDYIIILID